STPVLARKPFHLQQRRHFLGNNPLTTRHFFAAQFHVVVRNALEVIYIVEINIVQRVDGGVYVTRDGNVDQQQRAMLAALHQRLQTPAVQDGARRGSTADDDVNAFQFIGPALKWDRTAAQSFGQCRRALGRAVGNGDSLDATR